MTSPDKHIEKHQTTKNMKKIYIIAAAALMAAGAQAQKITFYDIDGKAIAADATVISNNTTKWIDYGDNGVDYAFDPEITIEGDQKGTLTVTAQSDVQVSLCCGGACVAGTSITKDAVEIEPGIKVPLQLELQGYTNSKDEVVPTATVNVTAKYNGNDASAVSIKVIMNDKGGAVAILEADGKYVRAINGGLAYDLAEATEVAVYDMAGRAVLATELQGSGILSTEGLQKGIYVYTVGNRQGGKVIVK